MSSGGAFWATVNKTVKYSSSPSPDIAEAPPQSEPATESQPKKGVVQRPMTNGSSSNAVSNGNLTIPIKSNRKKLDWDDEDEDDRFLAQISALNKQSANTAQEAETAGKKGRIKELEETVTTKAIRIAELERVVEEKDYEINDLESNVQEKDTQVEELKTENYHQFIQIQELYHEMDEKDATVQFRTLKQESVSKTRLSTNISEAMGVEVKNTSAAFQEDAAKGIDGSETETTESTARTPVSDGFEMADAPRPKNVQPIQLALETSQIETPKDEKVTKTSRDPCFGKSDFPIFSTKETLKVVPPAPKPKTLSFPMDMSKYGKKAPPVAKQIQASTSWASQGSQSTSWGQSSKQARVKTNTLPSVNPSKDIRHMPHGERILYANGPDVVVKLGNVQLTTIPKQVLMQCSGKAMQYFTSSPNATSWIFLAGSMEADAANVHLNWMDEMTYQDRVYSITLNTAATHDQKNLRICRAARVLGLNNAYVGHFTKQFCERIRNEDVSHEFMDTVCELAYPDNDPIFDCLTNNLVTQKKNGNMVDAEGLNKLMAKHPLLKTKMEQVEKRMGGGGRARKSPESSERASSKSRGAKKDAGKGRGNSAAVPGYNPIAPAREKKFGNTT